MTVGVNFAITFFNYYKSIPLVIKQMISIDIPGLIALRSIKRLYHQHVTYLMAGQ